MSRALLQAQTGRVYKPSFTASSSLQPKSPHSSSSHATKAAQASALNAVWQSPVVPRPGRACTATAWCGPHRRSRRGARTVRGSGPAQSPPARPRHTCIEATVKIHALSQLAALNTACDFLRKSDDWQFSHADAQTTQLFAFSPSRRQRVFAPGWAARLTPAQNVWRLLSSHHTRLAR